MQFMIAFVKGVAPFWCASVHVIFENLSGGQVGGSLLCGQEG